MTQQLQETWDAFLREWPIERLRTMTLRDYSSAGEGSSFTSWIESRLDQMRSIWGGSCLKFGIYSRRDKTAKAGSRGASYTQDYAWYTKYGASPEEAFEKVGPARGQACIRILASVGPLGSRAPTSPIGDGWAVRPAALQGQEARGRDRFSRGLVGLTRGAT